MNEAILDLKALDELDEFLLEPESNFTKEELKRMDAITSACIKAYKAEKELEIARKNAIETASNLARLITIDKIERAKNGVPTDVYAPFGAVYVKEEQSLYEPIRELKNLDLLEDMVFCPPPDQTKEEEARLNAITTAWFQARDAEKALEEAQKRVIETAKHLARLDAIDEMERAKKTSNRRRAATAKDKEVCTA